MYFELETIVTSILTVKCVLLYVDPNLDGTVWEQTVTPTGSNIWIQSEPINTLTNGINSILPSILITTPNNYNEIWYKNNIESIQWTILYDLSLNPSPLSYLTTVRINLYRKNYHPNNFVRTIVHNTPANNIGTSIINGKNYLYGSYNWNVTIPQSYSVNEFYRVVVIIAGHTALKGESNGNLRIMTLMP